MSWAKRNIYFLASCIVAVVLLGAAGWYCYSSMQANNANWEQLQGAYKQLGELALKSPGPGNEQVDNIKAAKEQTDQVKQRVQQMEKLFTPVRGIPDTNKFNERAIAFAVRETVSQLRRTAQEKGVVIPAMTPEFAFSFSLQMSKTTTEPTAAEMLSRQLGEVKTICDVLFNARILQLDSIQRERTPDDANLQQTALQPDYADSISLASGNTVITPYQVAFQCFTPQLGAVLASFANQPHTIVVKTLSIQPADQVPGGGGGYIGGGGGYPGGGGGYPAPGAYGENPAMQPGAARAGGLPTIIDEKKLKVIMLVDFVKINPAQGR